MKEQPKILCSIKTHDLSFMADVLKFVMDWGEANGHAKLSQTLTADGYIEISPVVEKQKRVRRKKEKLIQMPDFMVNSEK